MLKQYAVYVENILNQVIETQVDKIPEIAEKILDRVATGGKFIIFGAGHGHVLAEEMLDQKGGFSFPKPYNPQDLFGPPLKAGYVERNYEFAEVFYTMMDLKPQDALWLISNSGTNGVVVELAKRAQEDGSLLIAHTNMNQTVTVSARHPSGKKMYEYADYIIDNCGEDGDAGFETVNGKKQGPTSNMIGTFILQALNVCFATLLNDSDCTEDDLFNGKYAKQKKVDSEHLKDNLSLYTKKYKEVLMKAVETQFPAIIKAAEISSKTVMDEGRNMMFGMVHDHSLVEEIHSRAGTIMCNRSIVMSNVDIQLYDGVKKAQMYSNIPEYANALLRSIEPTEKDCFFCITQSSNEPAMRRFVELVKENNASVIVHTNKNYADACSEQSLYLLADVVLDNCCPAEETMMEIGILKVGYPGTSISCFINQCYVISMTRILYENGIDMPTRISINTDKGLVFTEELNRKYFNDTIV